MTFWNEFFFKGRLWICVQIPLNFAPNDPVDNKPDLVHAGDGLALNRRQAIIWTDSDPVHWGIYASLGLDWITPLNNY